MAVLTQKKRGGGARYVKRNKYITVDKVLLNET